MIRKESLQRKALSSHLMTAIASIVILVIAVYFFCYHEMRQYATQVTVRYATSIAAMPLRSDWRSDPGCAEIFNHLQHTIGGRVLVAQRVGEEAEIYEIQVDEELEGANEHDPSAVRFASPNTVDAQMREIALRAFEAGSVQGMGEIEFFGAPMLYAGELLDPANDHGQYAVLVFRPTTRLNTLHSNLTFSLGISLLVAVLISVNMSMLFVSRLMHPIQMETVAAERLAEGDYTARVPIDTHDEIGRLGETLNELASRVDSSMRTLRGERDQLNAIINNIDEGLLAVNHAVEPVYFNQAFLEFTELSSPEQVVAQLRKRVHFQPFSQALQRALESGASERAQWRSANGRSILAILTPVMDEHSDVAAICLLMDVSESERLEHLRRDFVANISHELRTPITGIRGMLEPIMDGVIESDEEKQRYFQAIHQEAVRMEHMVNEILEISRLQDISFSIPMQLVDLYGVLDSAIHNIRTKAQKANVLLSLGEEARGQAVWGNFDRLYQVIVILLDNAVKFTPEGGSVTIQARLRENMIDVAVSDTGCGIEPRDLKFIWERFFKADRSRSNPNGTGLGLPIAKLLVEKMDGEIRVESRVREGTVFTVSMRRFAPDDATENTIENT
ncbi:MAG: HAMP domain-containing protein [Clostridia bacterium]|nr:HAMP domain-containing protein [Clostridia bacterium]